MRVCIVASEYPPRGYGVGNHVASLASALVRAGDHVHVLTRGNRTWTDVNGVTVSGLPCPPAYPYHVYFHSARVNHWLSVNEADYDLVHAHSPLIGPPRTDLPVVATSHGLTSSSINALGPSDLQSIATKLWRHVLEGLDRQVLKSADRLIAFSKELAEEVKSFCGTTRPVEVIPNGVDTEFFDASFGMRDKTPLRIVFCGRLVAEKGIWDLLAALHLLKADSLDFLCYIAGSGPLSAALVKAVRAKGLSQQVAVLGRLDKDEIRDVYKHSMVLVLPSLSEAMPASVLEAMASGLPVVSTSVGGLRQLVQDGENGFIVPPHSPDAVAEALRRIAANPEMALDMGKRARERVSRGNSWSVVSEAVRQVYQRAIAAG